MQRRKDIWVREKEEKRTGVKEEIWIGEKEGEGLERRIGIGIRKNEEKKDWREGQE